MKERFLVLDIFRGVFASFVVFFHMSTFTESHVLNNNLVHNADLFVDFFFVLSGFVITYSYQHISSTAQFSKFFKKRFYRLYPLHVIMLFVFLFVEVLKNYLSNYVHVNELNNPNNNATSFISSLFLINSVKIPGVNDVSWNMPSWSISAEMISYLLFGLLMILIHKLGLFKARVVCYASILLLACISFFYITGSFKLTYSFDYGFFRGIIGFFSGMICFNLYAKAKANVSNFATALFHTLEPLLLLSIFYLVSHQKDFEQVEYIYIIAFFCAIFIFAFEKGIVSTSMKRISFLESLGKYSYSIYMTHALLLSLFNVAFVRILKFPPSSYAYLFIVNYMLVYAVSHFTYKHIEMRFALKKDKPALRAAQ